MSDSVRNLWVSTLHQCAAVHQSMVSVTKTIHQTSEQHVELGVSRKKRDFEDFMKVCAWVDQFNPFDIADGRLRSLSNGLACSVNDDINCDEAEEVGRTLQGNNDNIVMTEAKVPQKITDTNSGLLVEWRHGK